MDDVLHPMDPERPLRLAVIGLGGAAQLIHMPLLQQMPSIELVGVSEQEEYKLARVSEKYGVPGFVDSTRLLEKTSPDAVLICTPTITHLPLALASLEAGAHVIVEKPATRSLDEAQRLAKAASEAGREVLVAMNNRFRQDYTVLQNFVRAGELGSIWRIRAGWMKKYGAWDRSPWLDNKKISGGGVLLDLGIQLVDMMLALLSFPELKRIGAYAFHENLGREVEDTVTACLSFRDGTTCTLDCSWGLMAERDVAFTHVDGSSASASLNPLVIHRAVHEEMVTVTPVKTARPQELYNASFGNQWDYFVRFLRGEGQRVSGIDEAVKVMEVIQNMYRSIEEQREIHLD